MILKNVVHAGWTMSDSLVVDATENGAFQLIVDYREGKQATEVDRNPLVGIDKQWHSVIHTGYFTLESFSLYYQKEIHETIKKQALYFRPCSLSYYRSVLGIQPLPCDIPALHACYILR